MSQPEYPPFDPKGMPFRKLGPSGLRVSLLSFGGYLMLGDSFTGDAAKTLVQTAFENGINTFDTADGTRLQAHRSCHYDQDILGNSRWAQRFRPIAQAHHGGHAGVPGTSFFAHRYDLPMEEIVRAFKYVIEKGWDSYWGTSAWPAQQIDEAHHIATKPNLILPIPEQVLHNIFYRERPEKKYASLYEKYGYGTTIWSPLSGGILTEKVTRSGSKFSCVFHPEGSRFWTESRRAALASPEGVAEISKVKELTKIAQSVSLPRIRQLMTHQYFIYPSPRLDAHGARSNFNLPYLFFTEGRRVSPFRLINSGSGSILIPPAFTRPPYKPKVRQDHRVRVIHLMEGHTSHVQLAPDFDRLPTCIQLWRQEIFETFPDGICCDRSDLPLLLPVFYAGLDPAAIPSIGALDAGASQSDARCRRAVTSLHCVAKMLETANPFSKELAVDFWPRISKWIVFLHTYRDSIPVLLAPDPVVTHTTFAVIINSLVRLDTDMIDEIPGIRMESSALYLPEIIEGAGGTLHDLASLLMSHMKYAIFTPQSQTIGKILFAILHLGINFMAQISDIDGPLNSALFSCGVIGAEVASLVSFTDSPAWDDDLHSVIDGIGLPHLLNILEVPPGYPHIRQALDAGLLQLIIRQAQWRGDSSAHVKELLMTTLPRATVYHSVLRALKHSLVDVQDLLSSEWTRFMEIAQARIRLMEQFDSGLHQSRQQCFNSDVVQCQSTDWRVGLHPIWCLTAPLSRLGTFSTRDMAFLRVLIHSDYVRHRTTILFRQMVDQRTSPAESSTVAFDYYNFSGGLEGVEVHPVQAPAYLDVVMRDNARPRIQRHSAIIAQGSKESTTIPIWLHMESSHVRGKLRTIARELPEAVDETQLETLFPKIYAEIQALLDVDVDEIHTTIPVRLDAIETEKLLPEVRARIRALVPANADRSNTAPPCRK
ncbi:hypothetical protein B0H13DRAFT_2510022 [Mycena leptocephala]|nr:hypothetical protein B0H13DRAFT_2510022 [Mycena leptocephala]